MPDIDYLNYQPNFKRDEKEKTGWIDESPTISTGPSQIESYKGKELEITDTLDKYEAFKESLSERIGALEKKLKPFPIILGEDTKRALEELGHESVFTPSSFRELFEKKESSPGEYLLGVLEKEIESEKGSIEWEAFIEYLEIEEEVEVLDYYIEEILYPILGFTKKSINKGITIKDLEKEWIERNIDTLTSHKLTEYMYRIAMISNPDVIAKERDNLHTKEEGRMMVSQEISQIDSSLFTIQEKQHTLELAIKELERIVDFDIEDEELLKEFLELEQETEGKTLVANSIVLLKQSIDEDNKEKSKPKNLRRNIYSKSRQKRIINEYSTINQLYREKSLPSLHYMKSFQDNVSERLNHVFNSTAESINRNYKENKEKTYESFLIQIGTSNVRSDKLKCLSRKEESRVVFQKLVNGYDQMS